MGSGRSVHPKVGLLSSVVSVGLMKVRTFLSGNFEPVLSLDYLSCDNTDS